MPNARLDTTTTPVRRPLSALLSQVLVAYTIELDNEFESRWLAPVSQGHALSLVVWTNLLRFIPVEDGIKLRDLTTRSLNSRESVKVQLGRSGALGVRRSPTPGRGRFGPPPSKRDVTPRSTPVPALGRRDGWGSGRGIGTSWVVHLTPQGKAAADVWPSLWAEIEGRWKRRFGGEGETLRSLRDIVGRLEVDLPLGLPAIFDTVEGESYPPRRKKKKKKKKKKPVPSTSVFRPCCLGFCWRSPWSSIEGLGRRSRCAPTSSES